MAPDFLGIGAQKCGTTWLYRTLSAHPEVWLPKEKELHFFDEKLENGRSSLWDRLFGGSAQSKRWRRQIARQLKNYRNDPPTFSDIAWDFRYFFGEFDLDWYERLFAPSEGRITGEITPNYSVLDRDQIRVVHDLMPQAKLIFLIRNPIERDWSQISMKARMGVLGQEMPPEAFDHDELLREAADSRTRRLGDYIRTLNDWLEFFPEENFFLGFLEEVSYAPRRLIRDLCDFLAINHPDLYPFAKRRVHSSDQNTIPTSLASELARLNIDLMENLSERLGGHADWWLYTATRLIDDPPDIPSLQYPLWESQLWDDWTRESSDTRAEDLTRPLQSGPYPAAVKAVTLEGAATESEP